jgi:hypothetical protein
VTPLGAGPEATLETVRQLLHNPPGPHTSPSAVEQWHHDIDQLIIATINTPPHGGQRANHSSGVSVPSVAHLRTPTVPHMPSVACAPTTPHAPTTSLAMADLWAKLEPCRSGDDDRVTIEPHRERHCNLDGDFGVMNTTPMSQAARTPTSSRSRGVCMVFAPHLYMVVQPRKF